MMLSKSYFIMIVTFLLINSLQSQLINGRILGNVDQKPLSGALIIELNSKQEAIADENGYFRLAINEDNPELNLEISLVGFEIIKIQIQSIDWNPILQEFYMIPQNDPAIDHLEFIGTENEDESSSGDVYSLLTSSKDAINRVAAYQFSSVRYSLRGIPLTYNQLGFNGFLLNDQVSGYTPFYLLSGQNSLTRFSDEYLSYKDNASDFGSIGLAQWIQMEPQYSRKEFTAQYAISNRNYTNRLGAHYSSGLTQHAWSFIAGANRRWAEEGYYEGSFYDAWGMYMGISKTISKNHLISALFIKAPVIRGKTSPGTKEVYRLSADNFYNSYWGFQDGEKRNSRQVSSSIPMILLNYQWKIKDNLTLKSGVMGLDGDYSQTRIDWNNASDPRPDYYQKLPSFIPDPFVANKVEQLWKSSVTTRQIDWDKLYQSNFNNIETIHGVNGMASSTVTGRNAIYWIEEQHADPRELEHFSQLNWHRTHHHIRTGYRLQIGRVDNYLTAMDLLGADFLIDREDFAVGENQKNPDIRLKNHLIQQDDRYGYSYQSNYQNYSADLEYTYVGKKIDFSVGGDLHRNCYNRNGNFLNAIFSNSLGESASIVQNGYGVKSIVTYKINGRNYIRWNSAYQELPNRFDQIFINPQWRADALPVTDQTHIQFSDISYFYRSPELKIQFTGYYIKLKNQIVNKNFFLDEQLEAASNVELADGGLINAFYTGLDQQHMGLESSVEWIMGKGFELTFVYNIGDHIYTSRPEFLIFDKFSNAISRQVIYLKNFYVPGSAQQAFNTSLKYKFKKSGFVELSFNFLNRQYLDPNPLRRIEGAIKDVDPESSLFRKIIDQEKLPSVFYVNAFIFKSYRIGKNSLGVSFSINNLLNSENIISGGFEQFRFDYAAKNVDKFPSKYYYLQELNFYLGISLRI